jgi:hypothetical protein
MNTDEQEILNYLSTYGAEFVGAAEICRRATTKKRYYNEPDWAKPILMSMKDRGILEADNQGRYRVKQEKKNRAGKLWVAPDIEKILRENESEAEPELNDTAKEADEEPNEQR